MRCLPLLLAATLLSAPAVAAERTVPVGSFDRVRVSGPVAVRIATGRAPGATVSGDPRAVDAVSVAVNGTTLTVLRRGLPASAGDAPVVTLSTPALQAVTLIGSGRVAIDEMAGERADLSVAGDGAVTVAALSAGQAQATVVGEGRITLAGRVRAARLSVNGKGGIDAARLAADDLAVRLDGPGQVLAQARYTAALASTGAGELVVTGNPRCTVRAPGGATVRCGRP